MNVRILKTQKVLHGGPHYSLHYDCVILCMNNFWPLSKFKQNPDDMYNYIP